MADLNSALLEDFERKARVMRDFRNGDVAMITLDIETTIKNSSPDVTDGAKIVKVGARYMPNYRVTSQFNQTSGTATGVLNSILGSLDTRPAILAGHNLKFDFKHLLAVEKDLLVSIFNHKNMLGIWDTMLAEYYASGQRVRMASLESLCEKHEIPFKKNEKVAEAFSEGHGADAIPEEELIRYLYDDLNATSILASRQTMVYPFIHATQFVQGWATLAYAQMELNGIPFSMEKLTAVNDAMSSRELRTTAAIKAWLLSKFDGKVRADQVQITPLWLSTVLYGFPGISSQERVADGFYKNGNVKYKTEWKRIIPENPVLQPYMVKEVTGQEIPEVHTQRLRPLPVNEEVIGRIIAELPDGLDTKALTLLLEHRKASKILNTYTQPLIKRLTEENKTAVNHTINQAVTATGRTSSSSPNSQNFPEEIRECVADDGRSVVSADFSQLEVWAAAILSGDPGLLHDVLNGDVHCEVGKQAGMWKDKEHMDKLGKDARRVVKGVVFGTIYGGGAGAISAMSKVPKAQVRKIQRAFKTKYPVFAQWQDEMLSVVASLSSTAEIKGDKVEYFKTWVSKTGRRYTFTEQEGKVKPTEVVNYPVQGFATGDFVPLFIAIVYMYSMNWPALCSVRTAVHDEIVITSALTKSLSALLEGCNNLMPRFISALWSIRVSQPPKLNVKISKSWG